MYGGGGDSIVIVIKDLFSENIAAKTGQHRVLNMFFEIYTSYFLVTGYWLADLCCSFVHVSYIFQNLFSY